MTPRVISIASRGARGAQTSNFTAPLVQVAPMLASIDFWAPAEFAVGPDGSLVVTAIHGLTFIVPGGPSSLDWIARALGEIEFIAMAPPRLDFRQLAVRHAAGGPVPYDPPLTVLVPLDGPVPHGTEEPLRLVLVERLGFWFGGDVVDAQPRWRHGHFASVEGPSGRPWARPDALPVVPPAREEVRHLLTRVLEAPTWMSQAQVQEREERVFSAFYGASGVATGRVHQVEWTVREQDRELLVASPPGDLTVSIAKIAALAEGVPRDRTAPTSVGGVLAFGANVMLRRAMGLETPVPVPWRSFALLLGGGFFPPAFPVIVGATSSYKSQLILELVICAALAGKRVRYLSTELSKAEIAARLMGCMSELHFGPMLTGSDPKVIVDAFFCDQAQDLIARNVEITEADPGRISLSDLSRIAKDTRSGPEFMVVDLMAHVTGDGDEHRDQLASVAQGLRSLARERNIVILGTSQTARMNYESMDLVVKRGKDGTISNADKLPPRLSPRTFVATAKDSGDVESSATPLIVLVRVRDEGEPEFGATRQRIWVGVAKNTSGPLGWAPLVFERGRFREDPQTPPSPTQASSPHTPPKRNRG